MQMKKRRKNKSIQAVIITCIVLILCLLLAIFFYQDYQKRITQRPSGDIPGEEVVESQENQAFIRDIILVDDDDKIWHYKKELVNILVMGIDRDFDENLGLVGTMGQADVLFLLTYDLEKKELFITQIPRDTMIEVDLFDISGRYISSEIKQIAAQYAYCVGEADGGWVMRKKVSELFYDIPIEGFLSMSVDGISKLNDFMGGVEVTVPEDYTHIDPTFEKGKTVKLTGKLAEKYVRSRDTQVFGSNVDRMARQRQYIHALAEQIQRNIGETPKFLEKWFLEMGDYIKTDLSIERMQEISGAKVHSDEVIMLPGELSAGEIHEEFYVDESTLKRMVLDMFFTE